jgi:hypothetical protein
LIPILFENATVFPSTPALASVRACNAAIYGRGIFALQAFLVE